jgi:hypothetical protein
VAAFSPRRPGLKPSEARLQLVMVQDLLQVIPYSHANLHVTSDTHDHQKLVKQAYLEPHCQQVQLEPTSTYY